jgi:putative nucleotidyltransferase with HDIG domain
MRTRPTGSDEMQGRTTLPRSGTIYVSCVTVAGLAVIIYSTLQLTALAPGPRPPLGQWYLLAALTFLSGSVTVRLPSVPATISVSETFVFTSVILYGPAAGALIVAMDGLVISIWLSKRRKELRRVAFNMTAPAVSIWLSAHVYYLFPGVEPLVASKLRVENIILPLAYFTLTHFFLNSWLIALAVASETKKPAFSIWKGEFLWLSLNYFAGASVSALLVALSQQSVNATYIGIIIPLLLTLYFTFKIPMARVVDANRHLAEVNSLHLSTIETLAMAVDAKDQVTHGHIRRVQAFAVGLARALAVSDQGLIKAIEASALLHDMGKLAIPEHILNKPGKLSSAEFAKMKMHASLGADILSAIAFPYPVIPIVRHHHENWDGSGYPCGLSATQIPIGARILAVVDCYDALTSDRPYRPALSDEEASAILLQRRGTMYDPLVVDVFLRVHRCLAPHDVPLGAQAETYADIARLSAPEVHSPGRERQSERLENAVAELFSYSLSQKCLLHSLSEKAGFILAVFLNALPATAGWLALYDPERDDLLVIASHKIPAPGVVGTRLALGEGLTGWVAANGRPMINSDAALDLASLLPVSDALRIALSVPLLYGHSLVGVASAYDRQLFSAEQLAAARILTNAAATLLSPSVDRLLDVGPTVSVAPNLRPAIN